MAKATVCAYCGKRIYDYETAVLNATEDPYRDPKGAAYCIEHAPYKRKAHNGQDS